MANVTAQSGFVAFQDGAYVVVQAGEERASTDPVVKAHPDQFSKPSRRSAPAKRRSTS